MSTLTDTALENRTEIADSDAKRLRLKRQVAWPRGPNVRTPDPRHRGEWPGGRRQTRRGEGAWPLIVFG
jgi:hypothetical protein